jgi:hypothetical protein
VEELFACISEEQCVDETNLKDSNEGLKGLSHEIDSKTFDKNLQNLA